jgi:hypothetical protein
MRIRSWFQLTNFDADPDALVSKMVRMLADPDADPQHCFRLAGSHIWGVT